MCFFFLLISIYNPMFAGLLACNVNAVKVTPTPPDPKNAVTINDEKPEAPTSLNVGSTNIVVEVTSEDGSNKQVVFEAKNIQRWFD